MVSFTIQDSVAFVTCTTNPDGVGHAIVHALLQNGSKKVYATARIAEKLVDLVEQYPVGRIIPVSLDVNNMEAINRLPYLYPDVTIVVNNASYRADRSSSDAILSVEQEIQVNYIAPLALTKAFSTVLKQNSSENKNVAVVNVNSFASLINFPAGGTLSASKAATHSLTQAQRRDLPNGLVVGIYPGPESDLFLIPPCPGLLDAEMSQHFSLEKTPSSIVAKEMVDALQKGQENVFLGSMPTRISEPRKVHPRGIEHEMNATPSTAQVQ